MGLDIRAFNGLTKCEIQSDEAYEKFTNCVNLKPNDVIFDQSCGLDGYYIHVGEYLTFRAGAYSSYGKWRSMLSDMMGYDIDSIFLSLVREDKLSKVLDEKKIELPFIELICFSDCEGIIGPEVSKKLYGDFLENKERAIEYSTSKNNKDWLSLYNDFLKAFKIASNNGCVEFS